MCIAIVHRSTGKPINFERFNQCANSNPDGFGLAYIRNGFINVKKELKSVKKAFQYYEDAIRLHDVGTDIMLHFRIATSGKKDEANCHPFFVHNDLIFCHNGILPIKATKKMSDTRIFNEGVLKKLDRNFLEIHHLKLLVELAIEGSKFVFLHRSGKTTILNEEQGIEDEDGNWYSNSAYKIPEFRTYGFFDYKKPSYKIGEKIGTCDFCTKDNVDISYNLTYNGFICDDCNEMIRKDYGDEDFSQFD